MGRILFEDLNQHLARCAAKFPEREAIGTKTGDVFQWTSFSELFELAAQARGGLAELGVQRGDRVAIVSDNRLEWVVLAFATYGLGAAFVPMYEALSQAEREFILEDSGAKIVAVATREIFDEVQAFASQSSSISRVIGLDLAAEDSRSYPELLALGRTHPTEVREVSRQTLAAIVYTSGTTGKPKGVCLSHFNICSNVLGALERFDFREGDRSLAFLPWAHVFGQTCELYSVLAAGGGLALNDEIPRLIDNLAIVRPTILVAVPRIFNRIYERVNQQMKERPAFVRGLFHRAVEYAARRRRDEALNPLERLTLLVADRLIFSKVRQRFGGRLRFVVSGSAALSPVVAEFVDALGIDVFEGYGLTESSPVVAANYPGHKKLGTVGPPFPGVSVRFDQSSTDDVKQGEIQVSGPNVMLGYHENPEATRELIGDDGWLHTGDMGYLDEDGFLHITGRIKEQYKLENGKYVVPAPLEEQLKLSPYITNVMIHGANRPYNVALIVLEREAIESFCREKNVELRDVEHDPRVKQLIEEELEEYSKDFRRYEKVRRFMISPGDFTTENGLLTPKMSLKRRNVFAKYGERLEGLYRE